MTKLTKEEMLKGLKDVTPTEGRNSMGTSVSWYDPFYLTSKCFGYEKLSEMSEEELRNLLALADFASDVFY